MSTHLRAFALCTFLSGCASYQALPLDAPSAAPARLRVDPRTMPFPELAAHRFDPSDGLDAIEAAMLAVVNNPDLKLARDDAAIAHAQAFSAGLLPDPQLALSHDLSNTGGPGATRAYSFGLNYDVTGLLTHASLHGAARSEAGKTDLNVLWQEWQVVSQVRLLFVKLTQSQQLMAVLADNEALFADRLRRTQSALERGLLSSEAVTPNMTALQDVRRQIFELRRQRNQTMHDFNALLGLDAGTVVQLQDGADFAALDEPAVLAAMDDLARRRPDLLALAAGYQAQDQRYRGALLAQFPALNVGLTRARDSSGVDSNALGVTLSLPIFNRNRGNIAIEKASRQKLNDEYRQRLQTGRNDIVSILAEQKLNMEQMARIVADIEQLSAALARGDTALRANNIDALLYANARAALLSKQCERINLQQAILEQRVALQTLLGVDLPMHQLSGEHPQ